MCSLHLGTEHGVKHTQVFGKHRPTVPRTLRDFAAMKHISKWTRRVHNTSTPPSPPPQTSLLAQTLPLPPPPTHPPTNPERLFHVFFGRSLRTTGRRGAGWRWWAWSSMAWWWSAARPGLGPGVVGGRQGLEGGGEGLGGGVLDRSGQCDKPFVPGGGAGGGGGAIFGISPLGRIEPLRFGPIVAFPSFLCDA